jgi:hypothetical protein
MRSHHTTTRNKCITLESSIVSNFNRCMASHKKRSQYTFIGAKCWRSKWLRSLNFLLCLVFIVQYPGAPLRPGIVVLSTLCCAPDSPCVVLLEAGGLNRMTHTESQAWFAHWSLLGSSFGGLSLRPDSEKANNQPFVANHLVNN